MCAGIVWAFRFGVRNFSLEKFLRFDGAKNRNRASVFVPVQTSQRLFPLPGKNPTPKLRFSANLESEITRRYNILGKRKPPSGREGDRESAVEGACVVRYTGLKPFLDQGKEPAA